MTLGELGARDPFIARLSIVILPIYIHIQYIDASGSMCIDGGYLAPSKIGLLHAARGRAGRVQYRTYAGRLQRPPRSLYRESPTPCLGGAVTSVSGVAWIRTRPLACPWTRHRLPRYLRPCPWRAQGQCRTGGSGPYEVQYVPPTRVTPIALSRRLSRWRPEY